MMESIQAKAKLLRKICKVIRKAKAEGVREPELVTLEAIAAKTEWNKYKSRFYV